jgi:dTDP-4-dehydrorhamnose reductase
MELAKRVLVVGGEGVLEKALNRLLSAQGFHPLKTDGVDFSHASQVNAFFSLASTAAGFFARWENTGNLRKLG